MFPGTVLIEGTHLSEARGSTRPLEMIGAANIDHYKILKKMNEKYSDWLKGCVLRECYFEPTFQKFKGELCSGIQIHVDQAKYDPRIFTPYRLVAGYLKAVHELYPEFTIFKNPPYEYVEDHLPIYILSGGPELKDWVEGFSASPSDFDQFLKKDESEWAEKRKDFLLY